MHGSVKWNPRKAHYDKLRFLSRRTLSACFGASLEEECLPTKFAFRELVEGKGYTPQGAE